MFDIKDIKIHPRCLFKELKFVDRFGPFTLDGGTEFDSQPAIAATVEDNNEPGRMTTVVGGRPSSVPVNTPEQVRDLVLGAGMLQYIHEYCEHVSVAGVTLNHHDDGGEAKTVQLLETVVLPWLKEILSRRQEKL